MRPIVTSDARTDDELAPIVHEAARLLHAHRCHRFRVQQCEAVNHTLAMFGRCASASFELGRERRQGVGKRRAATEGDSVHAGEHLVTAEILGHDESLRCCGLLVPPAVPQGCVFAVQRNELVVCAEPATTPSTTTQTRSASWAV